MAEIVVITPDMASTQALPRLTHFSPFTIVEMQELEVTPLNDDHDLYKVCLEEDGISACTLVSSMHLVEPKRAQLKNRILAASLQAFDE
jgi:hypothetical protein